MVYEAQELTAVFSSVSGQDRERSVVLGTSRERSMQSVRILRQRSRMFIIDRPQMPVDSDILGEIVVVKEDKKESSD